MQTFEFQPHSFSDHFPWSLSFQSCCGRTWKRAVYKDPKKTQGKEVVLEPNGHQRLKDLLKIYLSLSWSAFNESNSFFLSWLASINPCNRFCHNFSYCLTEQNVLWKIFNPGQIGCLPYTIQCTIQLKSVFWILAKSISFGGCLAFGSFATIWLSS